MLRGTVRCILFPGGQPPGSLPNVCRPREPNWTLHRLWSSAAVSVPRIWQPLGSNFLVTGQKIGISIQFIYPVAARVSGAGAVLDASPLVLGARIQAVHRPWSNSAAAGSQLGIETPTHDESIPTFSKGTFIETNGTMTPEFLIHGPFSTAGGNGYFEVGLASNGTKAFFVQSQELTSGVETDLLGLFIDASGTVSPDFNHRRLGRATSTSRERRGTARTSSSPIKIRKTVLPNKPRTRLMPAATFSVCVLHLLAQLWIRKAFSSASLPVSETDPNLVSLNGVTMFAGAVMKNDTTFANYRIIYEQRNADN